MRCELCYGSGVVPTPFWAEEVPCSECNGTGSQNCCEGLREQPEDE